MAAPGDSGCTRDIAALYINKTRKILQPNSSVEPWSKLAQHMSLLPLRCAHTTGHAHSSPTTTHNMTIWSQNFFPGVHPCVSISDMLQHVRGQWQNFFPFFFPSLEQAALCSWCLITWCLWCSPSTPHTSRARCLQILSHASKCQIRPQNLSYRQCPVLKPNILPFHWRKLSEAPSHYFDRCNANPLQLIVLNPACSQCAVAAWHTSMEAINAWQVFENKEDVISL